MGQHAGLGGDFVALDDGVEHFQHGADGGDAVGGRVDAEHGVAVAVEQAVEDARGDAGGVVRGVVGLQPGGEPAAQAHGVAKARDHADLLRHQHQILHAHDLRHGGGHFRRQAGGEGAQAGFVGVLAEQPVAQATHRQVADRGEGDAVVAVDDQAGDFVFFVGNQRLIEEVLEGNVRQGHLRGDALAIAGRSDAGQVVAGACRAGLGHDFLEAVEAPGLAADDVGKACHFCLRPRVNP
ncbi:hypothetical protein D3C84_395500 [compost metagenome]